MIGVFDYTVILTYLSAVSAVLGMLTSLSGSGHPYIGCFFLLFCGLCDAFDGKVARTKKDRTDYEKKFGVQIDSLADILAFGALPVCIGGALIRISPSLNELLSGAEKTPKNTRTMLLVYGVMMLYLVMGVARLAHYNVTEDERQSVEEGGRMYFQGIPITSACIIFSTVLFFQSITKFDMTITYFVVMFFTALGFVIDVKIPKPGTREILIMIGIGGVEFLVLLLTLLM